MSSCHKVRGKRSPGEDQARQIKVMMFGIVVVAVLGAAAFLLMTAFTPVTPPPAENTIDVRADMGGFDKDVIRVKAGEAITVRLTSLDNSHHTDGGGQHQWAVDEMGVSLVAQPLSSNSVTFTPDQPGEYLFYCDICCGGRANPNMQGTLIVEA